MSIQSPVRGQVPQQSANLPVEGGAFPPQDLAFAALLDLYIEAHESLDLPVATRQELASRAHEAMVAIAHHRHERSERSAADARDRVADLRAGLAACGHDVDPQSPRWRYVRAALQ